MGEPAQNRTMVRRGMSNFRADHDSPMSLPPGVSANFAAIPPISEVTMVKPSSPDKITQVVNTCIVECNNEHSHVQRSAFFLSALASIMPGLVPVTREVIRGRGYSISEITDATFESFGLELQGPMDIGALLVVFGQLVFILFKNIDERSYTNFMRARITALKSEAGVLDELVPGEGDILFSFETARSVSVTVGSHPRLRAHVLKVVIANRDGDTPYNRVCNYIAEILSWTEMSNLVFIVSTLLTTNSPVLYDARVSMEVMNLYVAYQKICNTEHPQYYKILHPTDAASTIIKSRFSTLAEVARRYQMSQVRTVQQFAPANRDAGPLVDYLYNLHDQHMRGMVRGQVGARVRYMTNFTAEEDERAPDEE